MNMLRAIAVARSAGDARFTIAALMGPVDAKRQSCATIMATRYSDADAVVSAAQAKGAATSVQRCPECNAEVGVTSYGCAFRVRPVKARGIVTPSLMKGAIVGVGLFAFVLLLVGLSVYTGDHAPPQPVSRFAAQPLKP